LARSHRHSRAIPLLRGLSSTSIAVAILVLLGAPAASAALTDDVAKVASGAGTVTEAAANALPSVPLPVEVPEVPKIPPHAVPKPSPPSIPTPSASSAADAETAAGDLGEEAGEATGGTSEAEGPAASAGPGAPSEQGAGSVHQGKPDRRSIGPAETAPLRRWRAYVWPAIALRFREALTTLLTRFDGFADFDLPGAFGLLSPPVAAASAEPDPAGVDPPATRADPPIQPPWIALPEGGMGLLAALVVGLLVVACFVSLARLVVGEELFEARYWRGHRG
jgi:hypothetical protein